MTDDQIFSISNTFKFIIKAYKNYFFTFVVISALAGSCMYINQQLLESIIKSAKQIQVKNTSNNLRLLKTKLPALMEDRRNGCF